jgi:hypothetical protein
MKWKMKKNLSSPGWPDWANFRLLGDSILWAVVWILQKWRTFLGYFFHGTGYVIILTKIWLGYILGVFFINASGHPVTGNENVLLAAKVVKQSEELLNLVIFLQMCFEINRGRCETSENKDRQLRKVANLLTSWVNPSYVCIVCFEKYVPRYIYVWIWGCRYVGNNSFSHEMCRPNLKVSWFKIHKIHYVWFWAPYFYVIFKILNE